MATGYRTVVVREQQLGPDLVFSVNDAPDALILSAAGELDASVAELVDDQVGRAIGTASNDVVLDLSGTTFLDSSGLRVLLSAHRRLTACGRRLVLRAPSTAVWRILEISGLSAYFDVEGVDVEGRAGVPSP